MRTKWDVMVQREKELTKELERLRADMEWMRRTEFGKPCLRCGFLLETERDFAAHFLIPNERYLNLGECPTFLE